MQKLRRFQKMSSQLLDFTGSPIAEEFYLDNHPDACIVGPVFSGKTHALFARAFRHIREQPPGRDGVSRQRIGVVRHNYRALKDTCVPSYQECFNPEFFGPVMPTSMTHKCRFNLAGFNHPFEIETLFRAIEDPKDIRGLLSLNLSFAIVNELREADAEVYGMLRTRCGRFPTDVPSKFAGVISDSNPWTDEHFAHKLFVTNPSEGFKLLIQPPGLIQDPGGQWIENPAAENPKYRQKGYYLNAALGMDEESQRVFLRSEWGSLRGQRPVATYYRDDMHCKEFEPWPNVDFIAGFDPGLNAATVIGQAGPLGYRAIMEVATNGTPLQEHLELVKREFARLFPNQRLRAIYPDPAGDQRSAQTGQTTNQQIRVIMNPCVVMPQQEAQSVQLRIDALQASLRQLNSKVEPMFMLHPRCSRLRKALQSGWRYREIRGSGGHFEMKPYKLDDASHIADACCYFILGGGGGRAMTAPGGIGAQDEFARACAARNEKPGKIWTPFHE
jgi:hypothetical protein